MARVRGPALSLEAHGTLGPFAYQQYRKGFRAIIPRGGLQPNSASQLRVKANFAQANILWLLQSDAERNLWRQGRDILGNRGKDFYMRTALNRLISNNMKWYQGEQNLHWPFASDAYALFVNFIGEDVTNFRDRGPDEIVWTPDHLNRAAAPHPFNRALAPAADSDHTAFSDSFTTIPISEFSLCLPVQLIPTASRGDLFTMFSLSYPIIRIYISGSGSGNVITARLRAGGTNQDLTGSFPTESKYHHICLDRTSGGTFSLYLDDVLLDTVAHPGAIPSINNSIAIGSQWKSGGSPAYPTASRIAAILFSTAHNEAMRHPWRWKQILAH